MTEKISKAIFVYGSLKNPQTFAIVTGKTLDGKPARLNGYSLIQSLETFPFIVEKAGSHVTGLLIEGITPAIIEKLDQYESEGELYIRKEVEVDSSGERVRCQIYIGNQEELKPYVERGLSIEDRLDEYLERTVRKYLDLDSGASVDFDSAILEENAKRELLSLAIEELKQEQIESSNISDFHIKHTLKTTPRPSLDWLKDEPDAVQYAGNYMRLALKFMVFNMLEERLRYDFRGSVRSPEGFYRLTFSSLAALTYFNEIISPLFPTMTRAMGVAGYNPDLNYADYAAAASIITDRHYSWERGNDIIERLKAGRNIGAVTLGAEIELSQIGGKAVKAQPGEDSRFDCFNYYDDFFLNGRTWKLGGHVDDHGFITQGKSRRRGFLEFALGRYRILGDVSRPSTQCPQCLSGLINSLLLFVNIQPHSLHINLGIDNKEKLKPPDSPIPYCCLLMIGGDIRRDSDGILREMRIFSGDIINQRTGLCLSRLNEHHPNLDRKVVSTVVEYQFPRLYFSHDYTPLIFTLKGYQLGGMPLPLEEKSDSTYAGQNKEIEEYLLKWAEKPTPLADDEIERFVSVVEKGLEIESKMIPGSQKSYNPSIVEKISEQLHSMNRRIKKYRQRESDAKK